jgi:SAM-dependent methyltransferase
MSDAVSIQRDYYRRTAAQYDDLHIAEKDEHYFALAFMAGVIDLYGVRSVLDIGSGTGRVPLFLKAKVPGLRVVGIEPSPELREQGYRKGLSREEIIDGNAERLPYNPDSFDLVCEFATLHHVPRPALVVDEMLRVARVAVFISDFNNFGNGGAVARMVKQGLNTLGLWPLSNYIKTGGKGYFIDEGDGLAYSYSVFNDFKRVKRACRSTHLLNTSDGDPNLYRSSATVAILGIKAPDGGRDGASPSTSLRRPSDAPRCA